MMDDLFSWHTYGLLNAAIIVSYALSRLTLSSRWSQAYFSQSQLLKVTRFYLIAALLLFLSVDLMNHYLPFYPTGWEWQSTLKQAYLQTIHQPIIAPQPLHQETSVPTTFSWVRLFSFIWLIGFIAAASHKLYYAWRLNQLTRSTYCVHQLRSIRISLHESIASACCYGFGRRQYILLPISSSNHTITTRHELQHIRQGDTSWLQLYALLSILFYCNPIIYAWQRLAQQLQEFACDEALILKSNTTPIDYAECLIQSAKQTLSTHHDSMLVMAMNGSSKQILTRRINMLFHYQQKSRRKSLLAVYLIGLGIISSSAIAINNNDTVSPLTEKQVNAVLAKHQSQALTVQFNDAILNELNRIRQDNHARNNYQQALKRMDSHKSYLIKQFKTNDIPVEMLALPLVESGYQALDESVNPVKAAGVWQIIPSTAVRFGLTVNADRDDRLSMPLATQAAITYLKTAYAQFHDWKLAVMAYEYGEEATANMIQLTGSRDPWTIARSPKLPTQYKENLVKFLTMFDTAVVVIEQPTLIG